MATADNTRSSEVAQTLDRGLQILEALGSAPAGMSITQLATELQIHRSIAARLLVTLAKRGFVTRDEDGRYRMGLAVFTLARSVSGDLLLVAMPMMVAMAAKLNATVALHVADGDEAVTLSSIEPPSGIFRLGIRPGSRYPIGLAGGVAILAGREPSKHERKEVRLARERGYAITVGDIVHGFAGIAAPIRLAGHIEASVGCVVPVERLGELEGFADDIVDLANRLSLQLG